VELVARTRLRDPQHAPLTWGPTSACFFWPIFCAFPPFGSSRHKLRVLRLPPHPAVSGPRAIGLRKQKIGKRRQAAAPNPSYLGTTRSLKMRVRPQEASAAGRQRFRASAGGRFGKSLSRWPLDFTKWLVENIDGLPEALDIPLQDVSANMT
jgi:hypothetical protein